LIHLTPAKRRYKPLTATAPTDRPPHRAGLAWAVDELRTVEDDRLRGGRLRSVNKS